MPTERDAFLQELAELCNKHGFSIGGCGCCGSPWVDTLDPGQTITRFFISEGNFGYLQSETAQGESNGDS